MSYSGLRFGIRDIIPDLTIGIIGLPIAISLQAIAPSVIKEISHGEFNAALLFVTVLFIYVFASFIAYVDYDQFNAQFQCDQDDEASAVWERHLLSWIIWTVLLSGVVLTLILDIGSCIDGNACTTIISAKVPGSAERVLLADAGLLVWMFLKVGGLRKLRLQYPILFPYLTLIFYFSIALNMVPVFASIRSLS